MAEEISLAHELWPCDAICCKRSCSPSVQIILLMPISHQTRTNVDFLRLGKIFGEIRIEIQDNAYQIIVYKMSAILFRPQCFNPFLTILLRAPSELVIAIILHTSLISYNIFYDSSGPNRCCPHTQITVIGIPFSRLLVAPSLTHWGRDKMDAISQTTFQVHFLEWKCFNCD